MRYIFIYIYIYMLGVVFLCPTVGPIVFNLKVGLTVFNFKKPTQT